MASWRVGEVYFGYLSWASHALLFRLLVVWAIHTLLFVGAMSKDFSFWAARCFRYFGHCVALSVTA